MVVQLQELRDQGKLSQVTRLVKSSCAVACAYKITGDSSGDDAWCEEYQQSPKLHARVLRQVVQQQ
jgi:hypothetical protein